MRTSKYAQWYNNFDVFLIYGVDHKIEFIEGDYMKLAPTLKVPSLSLTLSSPVTMALFSLKLQADAVFLSPPWGGPSYLLAELYDLSVMVPDGYLVIRENEGREGKSVR